MTWVAPGGGGAEAGGDHCGAGADAGGGQPRHRVPRRVQQGHLHPLARQRPGALRGCAGGAAGGACAPATLTFTQPADKFPAQTAHSCISF